MRMAAGNSGTRRALILMAAALSGACSGPGAENTRSVEVSTRAVATGKVLFATCAACHGSDAQGRIGVGPRIASESYLAAASDSFLLHTIREGRAGTTMVAWKDRFDDGQIEALVAYLRSLHDVEPADLDESPLRGDVANGEEIFRSICSGCHGRAGAGYQETANGTGIGRRAFLDSVSDGFIRYVVAHGKTQTAMRGFSEQSKTAVANLSQQEIDDTIAYLRESSW
ncbi:MAG: c-type cytochrome [bacterium]|nr:c-type cytochrome [bacterium]